MKKQNLFFAIVGLSGSGKNAIMEKVSEKFSQNSHHNLNLLTTATTRERRPEEIANVHHFFMNDEEFQRRENAGEFLETSSPHGRRYGTLKETFLVQLNQGSLIKDIDAKGVIQIKGNLSENICRTILLMPPSVQELERRLLSRGNSGKNRLTSLEVAKIDLEAVQSNDSQFPFQSNDLSDSWPAMYDFILFNNVLEEASEKLFQYMLGELDKA